MHPRQTGRASGRHITHNARISGLTATGNKEIHTRLDKASAAPGCGNEFRIVLSVPFRTKEIVIAASAARISATR